MPPDAPFSTDPDLSSWHRLKRQLVALRERIGIHANRRRLMVRLFGPIDAPTEDGRKFMLMLAEEAGMGATDIAPTDREETARAAKRALVNRLLAAWDGSEADLLKLRAQERELTEEIEA